MNNKPFLISAGINILLLLSLTISIIYGVHASHKGCPPESVTTVVSVRDSIVHATDTTMHEVLTGAPRLTETKHAAQVTTVSGQLSTVSNYLPTVNSQLPAATCTDTNYYCQDTMIADSYKASATAIVSGNELIKWDVKYVNLMPSTIRIETVTKTIIEQPKSAMFKVYAGALIVGNQQYWGMGLKADIVINDKYMIGYGFDAKNLTHQLDVLMKINFSK